MTSFLSERLRRCADQGLNPGADTLNEAANRIDELEEIIRLAIYMRQRQAGYFKDRNHNNLMGAKQAEAKFDKVSKIVRMG